MNVWLIDGLGFMLLLVGMRLGQPKFLRALCSLAFIYLLIFTAAYYSWLNLKFHDFKAHPGALHVGISAAFAFQGFWRTMGSMLLLQGIMPVAVVFLIYFTVKWLSPPMGANKILR